VQELAPVLDVVNSDGHLVQLDAEEAENVPTEQLPQTKLLAVAEYRPALHPAHEPVAGLSAKYPAGQSRQAIGPVSVVRTLAETPQRKLMWPDQLTTYSLTYRA